MHYTIRALQQNPELAVFLTLAVGFVIGRIKIGNFSLGIVVGTLLAGVLIGQLDIKVPSLVKTIFFDLFLFTTGYKVGPQFFRGLKKDALPQMALTVVLCVTCLVTAYVFSKLLGYDTGTAAGLLAGAFSESTVIGTAGEAIGRLSVADADKAAMIANIPVAYAVTYLVGTAVLVWFLPTIGPKLMRINLQEEGKRSHGPSSAQQKDDTVSSFKHFDIRAYSVENPELINKSLEELEARPKDARVFIVRIRRGDKLIKPLRSTVLGRGDVVAVIARKEIHVERGEIIGPEVEDEELLDIPVESLDAIITNRDIAGMTLAELARLEAARGVFVRKLLRSGQEMPLTSRTRIDRGDGLRLIGPEPEVERAVKAFGYPDRPTTTTDMVFVGTGIFLGGLVGLLSLTIMGLVFGWLRSVYPFFGRIPEPAIWIFDTVGLCIFIGIVGLTAGPGFIAGLKKTGISLVFIGLVSSLLPHTIGILFGRYVLKMEPLIVLGACAGAGTITAALRAVQDEAKSTVPALGYTVPYAVGNILLTAWGPVLVAMMSIGK